MTVKEKFEKWWNRYTPENSLFMTLHENEFSSIDCEKAYRAGRRDALRDMKRYPDHGGNCRVTVEIHDLYIRELWCDYWEVSEYIDGDYGYKVLNMKVISDDK